MSVIAMKIQPAKEPGAAKYGDLLTVSDVCELTGLSPQTVRRHVNSGVIPGSHVGRRIYVPKDAFMEQLSGRARHEQK